MGKTCRSKDFPKFCHLGHPSGQISNSKVPDEKYVQLGIVFTMMHCFSTKSFYNYKSNFVAKIGHPIPTQRAQLLLALALYGLCPPLSFNTTYTAPH